MERHINIIRYSYTLLKRAPLQANKLSLRDMIASEMYLTWRLYLVIYEQVIFCFI